MSDLIDYLIDYFERINKLLDSIHFEFIWGAIFNILIIIVLFKAVDVFNANIRGHIIKRDKDSQLTQFLPILDKIFKFLIVFFVLACFLQSHGYSVSSLITGFGITGLAVGFAANATISSIFGTLAIFSDKAYKIGDFIIVNGVEGTVEDVNLRSTKIRTLDNFVWVIPNSSVATGNICNISQAKRRRIMEVITVTYSTSNEKLKQAVSILEKILKENKRISDDSIVFFDTLDSSSINIKFVAYAKTRALNEMLKIKSEIIYEIIKQFRAEGIEFAFPSTSVYMEKVD